MGGDDRTVEWKWKRGGTFVGPWKGVGGPPKSHALVEWLFLKERNVTSTSTSASSEGR